MASTKDKITIIAALLVGAVACGGSSANTAPATSAPTATEDNDDAAAGLMEHHRYHHHGGVMLFIAMSIDTLGVSPEQHAAVEKIRSDLHVRMEPAHVAEQSLVAALADGVDAASIDTAKIDAAIARLASAAEAVHSASTDALNELHAVLTPVQRAELVEKVNAHWAVWQKANAEEAASNADGHLTTLAADLGLTADQVDKVRAGLGEGMKSVPRLDPQEVAAHLRAFGDAFKNETFDAKQLATATVANAHMVGWGAARMAHLIEAMSPVLTPDQRTKLAQRLREHGTHNPSNQGIQ